MAYENKTEYNKKLYDGLKIDCEKCFGFCCAALYFSAAEGFPNNKDAGKPCVNLQKDFKCAVHKNLRDKGLKGCTAYDCFGAGQKVAQLTYSGHDWQRVEESAKQMFEVFLVMRQLHEMLWYLAEALRVQMDSTIESRLSRLASETERLTRLDADSLIKLNIESHRDKVNTLVKQTSELVRSKAHEGLKHRKAIAGRLDLIGADLRKNDLRGADLRGALLIAANLRGTDLSCADFIAADLRDTDLRDANLTDSIFVTQSQINSAKGNSNTKLPVSLVRPAYWDK
jgi:uncharacterized protein YjbI with pentapeptide repeats